MRSCRSLVCSDAEVDLRSSDLVDRVNMASYGMKELLGVGDTSDCGGCSHSHTNSSA